MRHFLDCWRGDESSVQRFADELGIAPGIVVGQLQHRKIAEFQRLNSLKRYQFDLTVRN